MVYGIGIDMIELARISTLIAEKPKFAQRVLTDKELELFMTHSKKRQIEFLAGRFACKEAFSKAYGTGLGKVGLQDIEVLTNEKGKPIVTKSPFSGRVYVSISHTESMAVAQILLEEI